MSLLVNTPDSGNLLVRSALRAWTVFRLTCSLHSVHCSLLTKQGKSIVVYFNSEHSFMDLRCATSSHTDECDIIHLCKYIQFKFMSRTEFIYIHIRPLRTGITRLWHCIVFVCVLKTTSGIFIIIKYIYNPSLINITFITVEDISASFCDKKSQKITKVRFSNIRLMRFSML